MKVKTKVLTIFGGLGVVALAGLVLLLSGVVKVKPQAGNARIPAYSRSTQVAQKKNTLTISHGTCRH